MKVPGDNVSRFSNTPTTVSASQMMTPGVVQIPGDLTVAKAAYLMQKEQIPCLLVKDADGQVGILTYTDIVKKVVAQGVEPQDVQVRTVVSRPVHSIDFDRPLDEASTLMAITGVPLLIVTRQDQPVGVLRARDLVYVAKPCAVRIPATITVHDGKHHAPKQTGTISNLSHLTATIEGPIKVPPGAHVAVAFTLPRAENAITAYGRIQSPTSPPSNRDADSAREVMAAAMPRPDSSDNDRPEPVAVAAPAPHAAPAALTALDGGAQTQTPATEPPPAGAQGRGWSITIQFTHLTAADQSQIRLWVSQQQDRTE
ncbi:MAG: CBS domain-containing protein [Nitrospiraceae bacterium]